ITLNAGRQVVGGLSVGAFPGEEVKLSIRGGELIVRRNMLVIGEEDRGSGAVELTAGALHCVGDTNIAAANAEPGRQCKGTLRISGGSFATRILTMGWGPRSEATLAIEGSRIEAVHVLDYVTLGVYQDQPPSTSTVAFTLDEHGVTPITIQNPRNGLNIVRKSPRNICRLSIGLSAVPPREDVTLIATHVKTKGEFDGLTEGSEISASFRGREYRWTLTYGGGESGCDVVLTKVRGHRADDPSTHTRPIPLPPKLLWTEVPLREPLPTKFESAFDGAEGFGAIAQGGRGGRELAVENLNDSGPGSLRAAVEAKGPRLVVFRVGGTIELKKLLTIREPFVTILGQSATGDGITLRGHGMSVMTHDVILRHLRIRPGEQSKGDDAIEFNDAERCIADHCSFEWGDDETCSITGLSDAITIQHCIIAEGLNHAGHSMASICGGERTTWHHNLFAHCRTRNPRFADVVNCDFRNNVIYNWGDTAAYGEFERVNLVANWFKPGPSTTQKPARFHIGESWVAPHTLFAQGNVLEGREDATRDNWLAISFGRETEAASPFSAPLVKTSTAAEAYESVLTEAGATRPKRDAVDERVIKDARSRTGKIIKIVREASGAVP
ncbi:MAG: hypothetical protein WCQ89_11630, partial [Verrucomicrobiota bacterium]